MNFYKFGSKTWPNFIYNVKNRCEEKTHKFLFFLFLLDFFSWKRRKKSGNKNVIKLFFFVCCGGWMRKFSQLMVGIFLSSSSCFFLPCFHFFSLESINNNVDIYSFLYLWGWFGRMWGRPLAGLKVYEICVRKNIIVSFFLLPQCLSCFLVWKCYYLLVDRGGVGRWRKGDKIMGEECNFGFQSKFSKVLMQFEVNFCLMYSSFKEFSHKG